MSLPGPVEKRHALVEKAAQLIGEAEWVLITTLKNPRGDALASALALAQALNAAGKTAFALIPGELNNRWRFLPKVESIKPALAATRPLVIRVKTKEAGVAEVKYEEAADALFFVLTPEQAPLQPSAVSVEQSAARFDLIITLGVPELEALEELQAEEPRLLYDTPILNLDNAVENIRYGELNLVALTVSSLAEVAFELIKAGAAKTLVEPVPTLLLTGIIAATNNFQDVKTTPDSLQAAAELIRAGADQQLIIKNLYRTKPLNALKLWGKAMINLIFDETAGAALTTLAPTDFKETGTANRDVAFVIDELKGNLARAGIVALLWQVEAMGPVSGYVEWPQPEKLAALNSELKGAIKNQRLIFQTQERSLAAARDWVLELLKALG